jgi:hypothetical protein
MIGLKELTLLNETIIHLGYNTSRYIKANPYVHPNWICNTILITFNFTLKVDFHLQWILWSNNFVGQHDVMSCNVMEN